MNKYDVVVVGAGLLGCFCARNLRRYDLSVAVIEKNSDVGCEMTKANTAVVYAGYDNKPGSMKAKLCVKGNAGFESLCSDLDVPFSRCGSLMLSFGEDGNKVLEKKYRHGIDNGVKGLELLNGYDARKHEKEISESVNKALFAPSTGTVNPWELCIAAYENARQNGAEFIFNTSVTSFEKGIVSTDKGWKTEASMLVDCSGINAGKITGSRYYVNLDSADYAIFDKDSASIPEHIIFEQSESKCKGITVVPTVEKTVLAGPSHRELDEMKSVSSDEIDEIIKTLKYVIPNFSGNLIRTFAGIRPSVQNDDGDDIHDFVFDIKQNTVSLIGIKTPGLTCSDEIGKYIASLCAKKLDAGTNDSFNPRRKGITRLESLSIEGKNRLIKSDESYGEIVCLCRNISKGEIIEAIHSGATSVEGIKHRCGATMGKCQSSRCIQKILRILEEENALL